MCVLEVTVGRLLGLGEIVCRKLNKVKLTNLHFRMKSCPSSSEQSNRKEEVGKQQTFLTTAGRKFPNVLHKLDTLKQACYDCVTLHSGVRFVEVFTDHVVIN
ncbi:hypothetical protein IFM89_014452 [Coptis chinensis]|uniref:Uncharacterized protein n=1 Tax=Coptis chinensis TaxID=261450 RepID=A0A835I3E5_9MAGN|nr:hypothetical protein IFM89_014452 [Coptis chinensis]